MDDTHDENKNIEKLKKLLMRGLIKTHKLHVLNEWINRNNL